MSNIVFDDGEIARLLGISGEAPPEIYRKIQAAQERVIDACRPRYITGVFSVEIGDGALLVEPGLVLPGKAVAKLLGNCGKAVCFAATIGIEIDNAISAEQKISMADAAILDAVASAAIESLCGAIGADIARKHAPHKTTGRYSPGYGDLPLSIQPAFLKALDAQRRVGVTCGAEGLMSPMKSVTAIIGIIDEGAEDDFSACAFCPRLKDCDGKCCVYGRYS